MVINSNKIKEILLKATHNDYDYVKGFINYLDNFNQITLKVRDGRSYVDIFVLSGLIIYNLFYSKKLKSYTIYIGNEISSYGIHKYYNFNIKTDFQADVVKYIVKHFCINNGFSYKIENNTIERVDE
jgi:hypothetical protein